MRKFTKQDIEELSRNLGDPSWFTHGERVDTLPYLFLAAGLQADGSPKPEPIRCWHVLYQDGSDSVISEYPPIDLWERGGSTRIISGTFVPDGAE